MIFSLIFSFIFSLLFFLFSSLFSSLDLLFFCLFLCLSFSVSFSVSLSLSSLFLSVLVCPCLSLSVPVSVCCCGFCCRVVVRACGVLWHAENRRVYIQKTSPCVPAPRPQVLVAMQLNSFNSCSHRNFFSFADDVLPPKATPFNTVEAVQVFLRTARSQLNVDITGDKEVNGASSPNWPESPSPSQAPRCSPPHRGHWCSIHTESNIVDPNILAVHLSWSAHERRKWFTSRGHKMAFLP